MLKEQQSKEVESVNNTADKKKEAYDKELEEVEEYYKKQQDNAQKTAEKMLLNVKQNQTQILDLLKKYGDDYEITGQTFGEKFVQGFKSGSAKFKELMTNIQKIQDTADRRLEKQITGGTKAGKQVLPKQQSKKEKVINIIQNNNIQQIKELQSEAYRKLEKVSKDLAAQIN